MIFVDGLADANISLTRARLPVNLIVHDQFEVYEVDPIRLSDNGLYELSPDLIHVW